MEKRNNNTYFVNPFIIESIMSIIFIFLVLMVTAFESQVIGVHEYNLIDLSSVIIIISVFTSGFLTGITTSISCAFFSIFINKIYNMEIILSLFTNKIIFVLILYASYLLFKKYHVPNQYSMYFSIIISVIIKKIFALLWILAVRGELVTPWYEHAGSVLLQTILYVGFVYLILDRIKKIVVENYK